MFFEAERMPIVQAMIMTRHVLELKESLDQLLPLQREDFAGLFRAMDGHPVIIRLIDPPLHEFLPLLRRTGSGVGGSQGPYPAFPYPQ